jgi:ABC-type sulfate transport system permease component
MLSLMSLDVAIIPDLSRFTQKVSGVVVENTFGSIPAMVDVLMPFLAPVKVHNKWRIRTQLALHCRNIAITLYAFPGPGQGTDSSILCALVALLHNLLFLLLLYWAAASNMP